MMIVSSLFDSVMMIQPFWTFQENDTHLQHLWQSLVIIKNVKTVDKRLLLVKDLSVGKLVFLKGKEVVEAVSCKHEVSEDEKQV